MGQGMWIWRLSQTEGGDENAIVLRARAVGLTHVVVKIADGTNLYNGDRLRGFYAALRAAAVKPYSWAYTYGDDPEGEAEAFAERAVTLDSVALIVDAEGDRYTNSATKAKRYMRRLREIVGPGRHVGLSTHRFPSNHPSLPIAEFMEDCDSGWPQAYYVHQGPGIAAQMERVKREWDFHAKPIVVTGAAYPEGTGNPANIGAVAAWCEGHGISQVNWWVWQSATEDMWSEIGAAARGV